jgi:hypothetical protein
MNIVSSGDQSNILNLNILGDKAYQNEEPRAYYVPDKRSNRNIIRNSFAR